MTVSTGGVRGRYLEVCRRRIKDRAQRGTEDAGRGLGSYGSAVTKVSCRGLENQSKKLDMAGDNDEAVIACSELTAKGIVHI